MSALVHRSTPETAMNPITRQPHPSQDAAPESTGNAGPAEARLRLIHDLIRSGDYHVPAMAIADRMIEQMIVERREGS